MNSNTAVSLPDTNQQIRQLGELFFQLDDKEQLIARHLYQLLSKGRPVEIQTISQHSGVALSTVADVVASWPGVFTDDHESIIGFWGLAIEPVSTHEFIVDGRTLYAWCAWDTLFMPAYIEKTCQVRAVCKQTGDPIELTIAPDGIKSASPAGIHLSFVLPEEAAIDKGVMTSFCHHIHFFRDRDAAETWTRDRVDAFVLSLAESLAAAHHKIAYEFQQLPAAS